MTEKIEWSNSYLLGVPKIDAQHKELLAIINKLYDVIQQDEEVYHKEISAVIKNLTDYTIYHFGEEEKLLTQYGYPTADFHKMQHTTFIGELSKQIEKLTNGKPEGGFKFYSYLLTWLINHIAKADKAWSLYVLPKIADGI